MTITKTASRQMHDALQSLNDAFIKHAGPNAVRATGLASTSAGLIAHISELAKESCEEILTARFSKEQHAAVLVRRQNEVRDHVINNVVKRGAQNSTGPIVDKVTVALSLSIVEQVENADIDRAVPLSRKEMIAQTEDLIDEVKSWDIADYAKQALLLQLNSISNVIQMADCYSDADLRRRVKGIVGDFASEYAAMDKKYQTKLERLVQWGRVGFFTGTTVLGLTADVDSVTALLSAPPKMISG